MVYDFYHNKAIITKKKQTEAHSTKYLTSKPQNHQGNQKQSLRHCYRQEEAEET